MLEEKILIIDFGSQVTQLIARRIRELHVYCDIHPYHHVTKDFLKHFSPKAIVLSGGPASVLTENSPMIDPSIFNYGVPILGICYGQQLICHLLGGKVEASRSEREFGRTFITVTHPSPFLKGVGEIPNHTQVWMSHGDRVVALPPGFSTIATSANAPFAIIADEERCIYGVQFHPEVTHTICGKDLFKNFLFDIAHCSGQWTMQTLLDIKIESIQKTVGKKKVLCAISGGVDSSVVATLLHRAIGDQLTCIFVDTGLLRKGEAGIVLERFHKTFHIPVHHVDASEIFLSALSGVSDPETKRKIIGKTFIDVFEAEARKISNADFLAQGTLYPDVIESVSVHGHASVTIKSHHNVGGLPDRMGLKLLEPVRDLFKDEVRELGKALGMHDDLITRHPFPGPGLAIRIPGEITREKIAILQEADAIYLDEIKTQNLYHEIWQAFAVLLPVKTVGVMGDARTYEYVCALRAVTSIDGMTADFYNFSHEFLRHTATRIINSVRGINRVVYDITSKPPGTIEWE